METLTVGRVLRIKKYIADDEFIITYGDEVSDINIDELIRFRREHGRMLPISTTRSEGRFSAISISKDGVVDSFKEEARRSQSYVNIGFMVANRKLLDYLG